MFYYVRGRKVSSNKPWTVWLDATLFCLGTEAQRSAQIVLSKQTHCTESLLSINSFWYAVTWWSRSCRRCADQTRKYQLSSAPRAHQWRCDDKSTCSTCHAHENNLDSDLRRIVCAVKSPHILPLLSPNMPFVPPLHRRHAPRSTQPMSHVPSHVIVLHVHLRWCSVVRSIGRTLPHGSIHDPLQCSHPPCHLYRSL